MRAPLLATALALVSGAGCLHITTKVPGVLDMRSDASEVPAETKPATGGRDGFSSILWGDGTQGTSNVTIQDRKYWVIGLIPVFNDSATEEIQAAVGDGVLRNVVIGEQFTLLDMGLTYCAEPVISVCTLGLGGILGLVLPPFDFKMTGTRGKAVSAGAEEPPPPAAPGEE